MWIHHSGLFFFLKLQIYGQQCDWTAAGAITETRAPKMMPQKQTGVHCIISFTLLLGGSPDAWNELNLSFASRSVWIWVIMSCNTMTVRKVTWFWNTSLNGTKWNIFLDKTTQMWINMVNVEIHANKTHLYLCVFGLLWLYTWELIHIRLDEQLLWKKHGMGVI